VPTGTVVSVQEVVVTGDVPVPQTLIAEPLLGRRSTLYPVGVVPDVGAVQETSTLVAVVALLAALTPVGAFRVPVWAVP
jgi:hypothetical protein